MTLISCFLSGTQDENVTNTQVRGIHPGLIGIIIPHAFSTKSASESGMTHNAKSVD